MHRIYQCLQIQSNKFPIDFQTHFNKIPVVFTWWWLCAHADPVYSMDFTWPYQVLANNYPAGSLIPEITLILLTQSSSRMRVVNHNRSATKQRLHLQSVAEISRHSVLPGNRIRRCGTSYGSCHKDTDQCLQVAISFCRYRSVPVPCENGSAETTVAEGGRNPVAGL